MANVIKAIPITSLGDPEILPWATGGTTLEPTTGQESNGWQPQAIAGPPDYRLENYARLNQSKLNARGVQGAIFVECCQAQITLAGYNAGVNQRRITINAVNFNVTDGGGSVSAVRDAFIAAINTSAAISSLVTASAGGAGILYVTDNAPGDTYSMTPSLVVSVLAGAGTITISSPGTTPIVREDAIGMASDLVIGSIKTDDDGIAGHRARLIWRKSKAALRVGYFSGTQADNAATGNNSIGLGRDCQAQGSDAVALGQASLAQATNSFAANGAGVAAGATFGVAIGSGASIAAAGTDAVAIGSNATITQPSGIAIGNTAASSGAGAVAIGTASSATASNALALMGGSATVNDSVAIGSGVSATTGAGAFASGRAVGASTLQATGIGSRTHGYVGNGKILEATGNGAIATGYAAGIPAFNNVQATGNGATAHGYNTNSVVSVALIAQGDNSRAIGAGGLASGDFSAAIGYGAKASNRGEQAQAACVFDDGAAPFPTLQRGSAQRGSFHVIKRTTDATANQVMTPGAGAVSFTPLTDTVYLMDCHVIAKEENVDDSYASWAFKLTIAYVAGVLTVKRIVCINGAAPALGNIVAGNPITHFDDGAAFGAGWVLSVDTSGSDVRFKVTGAFGKNIRWSARADYVCVGQKV